MKTDYVEFKKPSDKRLYKFYYGVAKDGEILYSADSVANLCGYKTNNKKVRSLYTSGTALGDIRYIKAEDSYKYWDKKSVDQFKGYLGTHKQQNMRSKLHKWDDVLEGMFEIKERINNKMEIQTLSFKDTDDVEQNIRWFVDKGLLWYSMDDILYMLGWEWNHKLGKVCDKNTSHIIYKVVPYKIVEGFRYWNNKSLMDMKSFLLHDRSKEVLNMWDKVEALIHVSSTERAKGANSLVPDFKFEIEDFEDKVYIPLKEIKEDKDLQEFLIDHGWRYCPLPVAPLGAVNLYWNYKNYSRKELKSIVCKDYDTEGLIAYYEKIIEDFCKGKDSLWANDISPLINNYKGPILYNKLKSLGFKNEYSKWVKVVQKTPSQKGCGKVEYTPIKQHSPFTLTEDQPKQEVIVEKEEKPVDKESTIVYSVLTGTKGVFFRKEIWEDRSVTIKSKDVQHFVDNLTQDMKIIKIINL